MWEPIGPRTKRGEAAESEVCAWQIHLLQQETCQSAVCTKLPKPAPSCAQVLRCARQRHAPESAATSCRYNAEDTGSSVAASAQEPVSNCRSSSLANGRGCSSAVHWITVHFGADPGAESCIREPAEQPHQRIAHCRTSASGKLQASAQNSTPAAWFRARMRVAMWSSSANCETRIAPKVAAGCSPFHGAQTASFDTSFARILLKGFHRYLRSLRFALARCTGLHAATILADTALR